MGTVGIRVAAAVMGSIVFCLAGQQSSIVGCAWRCRCCFRALERELEIESSGTADALMQIR